MICHHDCSEIIARTQKLFVYIFPVVKHIFNASYIFHVHSIELMLDADYRLRNKVDKIKKCSPSLKEYSVILITPFYDINQQILGK